MRAPIWLLYMVPLLILGTIWTSSWRNNKNIVGGDLNTPTSKLHGNFLHITDMHPDPHYKTNATARSACHVKKDAGIQKKPKHMKQGRSGAWGAPATICDSPMGLINATFSWLETNWADKLDFIIWTGDNARHDNDDRKPRKLGEIFDLNRMIASKFLDAFSAIKRRQPRRTNNAPRLVTIIPSIGNNDIYPNNIIKPGPNHILDEYADIWSPFIPKKGLETFRKGGYYFVEVIKDHLIVISLNTLYFFDSNTAVKGCEATDEPGTLEMTWLSQVLHKAQKKGMKVYLTGHVAPTKKHYTASCWKKYNRLAQKHHEIILGHLYGHSNMDHFYFIRRRKTIEKDTELDDEDDAYYDEDEFDSLGDEDPVSHATSEVSQNSEGNVSTNVYNIDHYIRGLLDHFKRIPPLDKTRANEYSVIHVNPSVIPTFFPALRIYQYNTTEISKPGVNVTGEPEFPWGPEEPEDENGDDDDEDAEGGKKGKKPRIPHDPNSPPHKNTFLTPISYTQYFINLTEANLHPKKIPEYQVEYTTRTDYHMEDLTIDSWLSLARRIAKNGLKGSLWKKFREHLMVGTRNVVKNRKAGTECMYGGCARVQGPEDFLSSIDGI